MEPEGNIQSRLSVQNLLSRLWEISALESLGGRPQARLPRAASEPPDQGPRVARICPRPAPPLPRRTHSRLRASPTSAPGLSPVPQTTWHPSRSPYRPRQYGPTGPRTEHGSATGPSFACSATPSVSPPAATPERRAASDCRGQSERPAMRSGLMRRMADGHCGLSTCNARAGGREPLPGAQVHEVHAARVGRVDRRVRLQQERGCERAHQ